MSVNSLTAMRFFIRNAEIIACRDYQVSVSDRSIMVASWDGRRIVHHFESAGAKRAILRILRAADVVIRNWDTESAEA